MRPGSKSPTAARRVVLDTNVLISASLSSLHGREDSPSFLIVEQFLTGTSSAPRLLISERILTEYEQVLRRPRLGIPRDFIRESLARIELIAEVIKPRSRLEIPDMKDSIFLECALDGLADYLVTGNKRDYPNWTIVVTPREFLNKSR